MNENAIWEKKRHGNNRKIAQGEAECYLNFVSAIFSLALLSMWLLVIVTKPKLSSLQYNLNVDPMQFKC